jgi:hypothetical protein
MDNNQNFIDKLASHLSISDEQACVVHDILIGEADPMENEAVQQWVRQCYNRPSDTDLMQAALNDVTDNHGVEYLESIDVAYLNSGDAYTGTLVWHKGDIYLSTYGDAIEAIEANREIPGKIDIEGLTQSHQAQFDATKEQQAQAPSRQIDDDQGPSM